MYPTAGQLVVLYVNLKLFSSLYLKNDIILCENLLFCIRYYLILSYQASSSCPLCHLF